MLKLFVVHLHAIVDLHAAVRHLAEEVLNKRASFDARSDKGNIFARTCSSKAQATICNTGRRLLHSIRVQIGRKDVFQEASLHTIVLGSNAAIKEAPVGAENVGRSRDAAAGPSENQLNLWIVKFSECLMETFELTEA